MTWHNKRTRRRTCCHGLFFQCRMSALRRECRGVTGLLRYVAPRLLRTEGDLRLPGPMAWITAFTTAAATQNARTSGVTLHRCGFAAIVDGRQECSDVQWRLESQPLGMTGHEAGRMVQGEARTLEVARHAALSAAMRPHHIGHQPAEVVLGPAFAAMPRPSGHPRIWGCAAVVAPATDIAGQDAAHHLCFIREQGGISPRFICTLEEEGDTSSPLLSRWFCDSVSEAAESGCRVLLKDTRMPQAGQR